MEECKRMGLPVLGPDVNESYYKFSVNKDNAIRFGMGAIKGVGHGAVKTIIQNRKEDGAYRSIFDLVKRIDLRAANKKAFQNLALAGGFDGFKPTHRAQYFQEDNNEQTFIERVMKYGAKYQENKNSAQTSLFGESSDVTIPEPEVPPCEEWSTMTKLKKEREVVGIYISGHPLDDFRNEIKYFCRGSLSDFYHQEEHINKELSVGGIITSVKHLTSKKGRGFGIFTLEGYDDSQEFRIFGDEYLKYRHYLMMNNFVFVKVYIREGYLNQNTGQRSSPRLQFRDFKQLQDVLKDFSKRLTIHVDVDELEERDIQSLQELVEVFPGNHKLKFLVFDLKEQIKIHMPSRRKKIDISAELLDRLEAENVHFSIN